MANPTDASAWPGGDQPWRTDVGEAEGAYYTNQDPRSYFTQFAGALADPNTNRGRYALTKFGQAWADYLRASEQDERLLWPSFLTQHYGKSLMQGFDNLGWQDRGEAPPPVSAGRIVW
jgi:hypothetical protein